MNNGSFWVVLLLLISAEGFSAQKPKKPTSKKKSTATEVETKKSLEPTKPKKAEELTSFDLRAKKNIFLGPRVGFLVGTMLGVGAESGYQPNSNLQFGLDFGYGKKNLDAEDDGSNTIKTTQFEISAMMLTGFARYFFGNSFYLGMGAGMRNIQYILAMEDSQGSRLKIEGSANSAVISPHLGNVWAFDNGFYLGCEWLGYSIPLTSSASSTTETSGTLSITLESLAKINQALAEEIGKVPSFRFLMVHLGVSF